MGMEFDVALTIRASLYLNPEMMENISLHTVNFGPMQGHNMVGNLFADLINLRVVLFHSGGGQLKTGDECGDWINIKADDPGIAPQGLY